jgi:hypothetical protein
MATVTLASVMVERSALGRLSSEGLRYGLQLRATAGYSRIWERLYRFNRSPISPLLRARWPTQAHYEADVDSAVLASHWVEVATGDEHFRYFRQPEWREQSSAARQRNGRFKIYVSPKFHDLLTALTLAINVGTETACALLKVSRTVEATVRPDKIILYTDSWDHTECVADALLARMRHIEAQGVPFTAGLDGDRLISWAIDPSSPDRRSFASWRVWITRMIVESMRTLPSDVVLEDGVALILQQLDKDYGVSNGAWSIGPARRGAF